MVTAVALPWTVARARCRAHALMLLRLLLAVTVVFSLSAQNNKFEGRPIVSVRIQPEDTLLAPDELAEALSALKPASPLRIADVRTTLQRLHGTGRYTNIE